MQDNVYQRKQLEFGDIDGQVKLLKFCNEFAINFKTIRLIQVRAYDKIIFFYAQCKEKEENVLVTEFSPIG